MESEDEHNVQQNKSLEPTIVERHRTRKAVFEAWMTLTYIPKILAREEQDRENATRNSNVADEELSKAELMNRGSSEIIKSPREYQLELFERAKQENTIAVLDTGSGKTLIGVLLIRYTLDIELRDREKGNPHRICFFLVPSVNLAYQQYSVLHTNLDHPVARVCGEDNPDSWDQETWQNVFTKNKVIVCTADVLRNCLEHSYISMKQINLLIFDEAHHTKKNGSYAIIVKTFYLTEPDKSCRPRIFGMTASPIDAKTDVVQASMELETLLDSKIATTLSMSLAEVVRKPREEFLHYAALPLEPTRTSFEQAVASSFGHLNAIAKILETTDLVNIELGALCADAHLTFALSEHKIHRYEVETEKYFRKQAGDRSKMDLEKDLSTLRSVIDFVSATPSLNQRDIARIKPTDHECQSYFSSKVQALHRYLVSEFEQRSDRRCIVFVDRRSTARLLSLLFEKISTAHMHCGYLIGARRGMNEQNLSFREQVITLIKFRKGYLNCLFATSVAEEGLDVPDCNLIIRYNLAITAIQYIQSRGRARHKDSVFVHMVEQGTHDQQLILSVKADEERMRRFCETLPQDRKLTDSKDTLGMLESQYRKNKVYTEPKGAKLTYWNALAMLAKFVSAIPNNTGESLYPTYVLSTTGSAFLAEVILPGSAPLRSVVGTMQPRKLLAKCSAAFEACIELRRKKYLNEHLVPVYQKKLPPMRNAMLAVGLHRTDQYTVRLKPSIWAHGRGTKPSELWMTTIDFQHGLDRKHQPMAILTRTPLPILPEFPIFLDNGHHSIVVSTSIQHSVTVNDDFLNKLSIFTFRIFKDVFSKEFEADGSMLSYWFVPLVPVHACRSPWTGPIIDLTILDTVAGSEKHEWTSAMPNELLVERFWFDKFSGGRKFFSCALSSVLKPMNPLPGETASGKSKKSILESTSRQGKISREKRSLDVTQPVIEAELASTRRNLLEPPVKKTLAEQTRTYICPEPLVISALSVAVATSCLVLPAVIHRFESYLIALEACSLVGISCEPWLALAAVTKDSDNSGDENSPRINFQGGMGENYERLEFIGDTFLKAATSISTFIQNPNDDEFEFHVKRMLMLCNQNLFEVAVNLKTYEYIRSTKLSRRTWYPEGLKLVKGKKTEGQTEAKHSLGQKTIADVSEALIGAALVGNDRPGERWKELDWDNAVRAVTVLVGSTGHAMLQWNDYRLAYEKPAYQQTESTASQRDLVEKAEEEHPYRFNYPQLLRSAFTHPSLPFIFEKVPSYQRLEFLGDALLDVACVRYLFYRYPHKDPHWLTEHKMAMVSNKFLGAVCVIIGFHRHLRYSASTLEHQIRTYAIELLEAKSTAGDNRDYWVNVSDPPKCLPDIVESYVGAMFIDSDFDFNVVQDFFDRHMKGFFEDMTIYDTFANNHPLIKLQKLLLERFGCVDYDVIARELPAADGIEMEARETLAGVVIHNEVIAHSKGKSGRYPKARAATKAAEILEELQLSHFKERFGCNCRPGSEIQESTDRIHADCAV